MVCSDLWYDFLLLESLTTQQEDHDKVNIDSNGSVGSQEAGNQKYINTNFIASYTGKCLRALQTSTNYAYVISLSKKPRLFFMTWHSNN